MAISVQDQDSTAYTSTLSAALEELPSIYFRHEITELSTEVSAIGEALFIRTDTSDGDINNKNVLKPLIAQYQQLKKSHDYTRCFNALDMLSSNLATQIGGVINTLTDVLRPEVDDLKKQITDHLEELLQQDNKEIVVSQNVKNAPKIDFEVFRWSPHYNHLGGEEMIIDNFKSLAHLDAVTVQPDDFKSIDPTNPRLKVVPIDLAENYRDYLVDTVLKHFAPEDEPQVMEVLNYVTCYNGHGDHLLNTVGMFNSNADHMLTAKTCADYIDVFSSRLDKMRKIPLNLSYEVISQFASNIEATQQQLYVVGYVLCLCRNELKDFLVLDGKYLNEDQLEAMQQRKLSESDLSIYITAMYNEPNIPLPNKGITVDEIVENMDMARTKSDERQTLLLRDADIVRTQYRFRSVRDVLFRHLEETPDDRIPPGTEKNSFVKEAGYMLETMLPKLDSSEDNNLDNFLYKFLIDIYYPNTIIATAHELFGSTFTKMLDTNPDLSENDANSIPMVVAANLAAEFLMTKILNVQSA